jgi:hypothetical protein
MVLLTSYSRESRLLSLFHEMKMLPTATCVLGCMTPTLARISAAEQSDSFSPVVLLFHYSRNQLLIFTSGTGTVEEYRCLLIFLDF